MKSDTEYIARYRQSDCSPQSMREHLQGCAELSELFAGKIGMPTFGMLAGLLHDTGKYSDAFQGYIRSIGGVLEPDDEDFVDARQNRGKIDHSSAGAQFIWQEGGDSPLRQLAKCILALCIASHHSGLIDCLSPDGTDIFLNRMNKADDKTHYQEAAGRLDDEIIANAKKLLASPELESELKALGARLQQCSVSPTTGQFMLGFLTRFLFSCLVDADRLNSAERLPLAKAEWQPLVSILEQHLATFQKSTRIAEIRSDISHACLEHAARDKGLYQLTVPTGGGKTLASLRFALHHAAKHDMDRIVYVVPFTSIIDQNARVARSVFAPLEENSRQIVLEHHSNLTPEQDTSESKLLTENWDAPIIYTTAVQFLETLFAGGTRGVRRLHQLANAVIIFDEIQTIPIRTVHLFNNAINFLVGQCGSTAVLCTATQPLLDQVEPVKGAIKLSPAPEMMGGDVDGLFRDLHRARIEDGCRDGGWSVEDIAGETMKELATSGSVLVIVNKKSQARELYGKLRGRTEHLYHLSTSMCPAHRVAVLDKVKTCLDPDKLQPVVCVSTQLIEAGVDVDFGSVIRYLVGLDSIAQAAGRCNRNGRRESGRVLIVNPMNEDLSRLPEMLVAQQNAGTILRQYKVNPSLFNYNLQSPQTMAAYYGLYFYSRKSMMVFPLVDGANILSLLSTNDDAVSAYKHQFKEAFSISRLCQSFMSAGKAFEVIDSPSEGVVVPHGEGRQIIQRLMTCAYEDKAGLLKAAQRYSVNFFPHEMRKLKEKRCVNELWQGSGIYWLDERHYGEEFGASTDEVSEMTSLII